MSCVTMKDFMNKFYETNELSDVVCDEWSNASGTEQKSNFEKKIEYGKKLRQISHEKKTH